MALTGDARLRGSSARRPLGAFLEGSGQKLGPLFLGHLGGSSAFRVGRALVRETDRETDVLRSNWKPEFVLVTAQHTGEAFMKAQLMRCLLLKNSLISSQRGRRRAQRKTCKRSKTRRTRGGCLYSESTLITDSSPITASSLLARLPDPDRTVRELELQSLRMVQGFWDPRSWERQTWQTWQTAVQAGLCSSRPAGQSSVENSV